MPGLGIAVPPITAPADAGMMRAALIAIVAAIAGAAASFYLSKRRR